MLLDMKTLCQYRLDHAKEDLAAAEDNHQAGFYMAAIDRSYHAIFHSIRAVNALDNFTHQNTVRLLHISINSMYIRVSLIVRYIN